MKNKIGFVGIGQCGGNVIVQGEVRGFVTGAMNTSPEDLNAQAMRIINNKLLLGKNGGCGKERKIAKTDVKHYHEQIIDFIKTKIIGPNPDLELVYLVFSTSGGTGSGMGPIIIDLLKRAFNKKDYPNLQFGAIVFTPSDDESPIALFNSRQCLEELYRLQVPVLIADNNKFKDVATESSRKALYDTVNKEVIEMIEAVCEDRGTSDISNMDNKDKLKLLKTPGITLIASTAVMPSDMRDEVTLSKTIQESWNKSVFANLDYDKIVKRVGYIFEINEKLTRVINHNLINRDLGVPMEVFEGIYKVSDNTPRVISILTGLSFPSNKIEEIDSTLEKVQSIIKKDEKKDIFGNSKVSSLFDDEDEEDEDDDSLDLGSFFDNY